MIIAAEKLGKRFRREWIFRQLSHTFKPGESYAVTGPNGSGKSTLLKVLSGAVHPSSGSLKFLQDDGVTEIPIDQVYGKISLAAPYLELVEEFTLLESLKLHSSFKQWRQGLDIDGVIEVCGLQRHAQKQLKNFSSGMKQRVRLAMALMVDVELVILDEPTSNLDEEGKAWYQNLIRKYQGNQLLFIGSNNAEEYSSCGQKINLPDYKSSSKSITPVSPSSKSV